MAKKKKSEGEPEIITKMPSPGELHKNHRERMRRRFDETRFDGWQKHEVIEYMLYHVFKRRNTNDLAHMLLMNSGKSLSRMFDIAQSERFQRIDGIGASTVEYLRELKAFVEYYHSATLNEMAVEVRSDNVEEIIRQMDFSKETEDILVICLNNYLRIKYVTSVTETSGEGFATTSLNRIVKAATACGADMIILVHNHPSGELKPSYDDIYMTLKIEKMLAAFDIVLVDHYITNGNELESIKMFIESEKSDPVGREIDK